MYLQCIEILAKLKFEIRALLIYNRNEKRQEKIWASPSKITGEKESGNTIWIFHWRSLCVCMHMCMYMCTCVCARMCMYMCVYVQALG